MRAKRSMRVGVHRAASLRLEGEPGEARGRSVLAALNAFPTRAVRKPRSAMGGNRRGARAKVAMQPLEVLECSAPAATAYRGD
jgi:hypothetical protein